MYKDCQLFRFLQKKCLYKQKTLFRDSYFPKWVEKHDWCVTTIPNFDGEAYIIHFSYPDPFFDGTHDVAYVLALGSHNIICWQTEA